MTTKISKLWQTLYSQSKNNNYNNIASYDILIIFRLNYQVTWHEINGYHSTISRCYPELCSWALVEDFTEATI